MQLLLWDMLRPVVKPLVDRVVGAMNVAGVIRPEATAKVVVRPRKPRGRGGGGGVGGSRGKARRPGACGGEASSAGAVVGEAVRQGGEGGEIGGSAFLSARGGSKKMSAQDRYDAVTRAMLAQYGIKVRKWRTSMSGVAYELKYRDGTIKRLIESPYPKSPMSAAIFLHEIGHHAIGFHTYKPRCLEEYHAWKWSLETMEAQGLQVTEAVRYRMHLSLWYAVSKATRRGIRKVPPELEAFSSRPERKR